MKKSKGTYTRNPGEKLPEFVERVIRDQFPDNGLIEVTVKEYIRYLSSGEGNAFVRRSADKWFGVIA